MTHQTSPTWPQNLKGQNHGITIVHDEEYGRFEHVHVPLNSYRPDSTLSKPEAPWSSRTSVTSSGSYFSQLDSPTADSIKHPEPATLRNDQIARDNGQSSQHSQRAIIEKNDLEIASDRSRPRSPESDRRGGAYNVYTHQGASEKRELYGNGYPDCLEEQDPPKLWKIMLYLILANPFICAANSLYSFVTIIMAAIISPFHRPEKSSHLGIGERSRFSTFICNQLLPLHAFHFRLLTARSMQIVESNGASTVRLILVHVFSPFVALVVSLYSICVFFAWIYGFFLGDSSDVSSMEEWIMVKWEAYLMRAFVGR